MHESLNARITQCTNHSSAAALLSNGNKNRNALGVQLMLNVSKKDDQWCVLTENSTIVRL
jgi:hypothetical protein